MNFRKTNRFSIYSFALCFFLLISGCKSAKEASTFKESDLRVSMSKGACFGSCPVYELKIYHGGYATFLGKQNTDKNGLYEKKLKKDEYNKIIKAIKKTDFESYPDQFKSNIPDLPRIQIGFHNGKTFRIVSGKEDRPEELMQVQFLLEKIVDNNEWNFVKRLEDIEDPNSKPEPSFIYNEVIIEPKKGLLLTKWLDSHSKFGVRLVKKIAPALNYYLIEFDTKSIAPKKFINMLYKDKDIKSAEFNKKTTQRNGR